MREINELLRKHDIKPYNYKKSGKCLIVNNEYVIKKNKTDIYDYLKYRNYEYYPDLIIDSNYEISEYIEEIDIPKEQKMIDLISIIALLHKKTTYYKKISDFNLNEIFEEIKSKINDVKNFYDMLITNAESAIFMSPSQYLLARNISYINSMLDISNTNIDKWYEVMKTKDKLRVSIIHNNLSLDHFLNNKLISWDNAKISLPIFDLYKLYQNTYNEYDFEELLNIYSSEFPLKEEEIFLFKTLICIPLKINVMVDDIDNVVELNNKLNYLKLTNELIKTKIFEE